jgi:hypothetical protein
MEVWPTNCIGDPMNFDHAHKHACDAGELGLPLWCEP